MKVVRTFSTSANLGPGFDTFGICFDLYNDYSFKKSNEYQLINFDDKYSDPKNNLIIQSYEKVFEVLNKKIEYIELVQLEQNIPTSRGLGSSASCIVSGIMIANDLLGNPLSKEDVFQLASSIEGHPDNVAPLIYGGLTCSFKDDKFYKVQLDVNKIYKFMVCIPPFELSTALARSVLPKEIKMSDAVFNISHAVTMIKALENGDMDLLKKGKQDKLHEPYRYSLIKDSDVLSKYCDQNNCVCMISGAGSTMLVISDKDINDMNILSDWKFEKVNINYNGAYVYEK